MESLPNDEATNTFRVTAPPLDTPQPLTVSTCNYASSAHKAYTGIVRANQSGKIVTYNTLDGGFGAVQISYKGGHTDATFPADLKQALTDLRIRRFNNATSGGQTVSSGRAGDYSETSDLTGKAIPGNTMEVLDSYKLPVAV